MINRSHYDIFEKLVQDVARIIAELIGAHTDDPLIALEQARQHYLQLEEKELVEIEAEDLLKYLLDKPFGIAQLELTGFFLWAEGKVCMETKNEMMGASKLKKARVILEYVEEHSEVYSEKRRDALREIQVLLT